MQPTPKLRFVNKAIPIESSDGIVIGKYSNVLQQWWEEQQMTSNLGWATIAIGKPPKGEWRDVPVEQE